MRQRSSRSECSLPRSEELTLASDWHQLDFFTLKAHRLCIVVEANVAYLRLTDNGYAGISDSVFSFKVLPSYSEYSLFFCTPNSLVTKPHRKLTL